MKFNRDEINPDELSPILEAAIGLHELFLVYMEAGFTERQALILVFESIRPRPTDG